MCCFNFERCDSCCRRLGCGCIDHNKDESRLESVTEINRSCTDLPCIGLFAVFILTMVSYVWSSAFTEGNPSRLIRGVNHAGKICGVSDGVKDLDYAFWPDLSTFRFKVCTDNCSRATNDAAGNHIKLPGGEPGIVGYDSTLYLDRYCIPSLDSLDVEGFDDEDNSAQRSVGDLELAMPIFGAAIAIAFVMSFLFVWLMKICVGCFVWGIVALILVCGMALCYFLYSSKDDENLSGKEQDMRMYAGIAVGACTFIFFCIIVFMRNRIRIAIEVIKSAGRAFGDMPWMVLFPIGPILAAVAFFWAWAFAAIYIFSAGEVTMKDTPDDFVGVTFAAENSDESQVPVAAEYEVIDYSETIQNSFAPHFFLLLWVVQFLVYFVFTVISGAVANWYFTERDAEGKKKRGGEHGQLSHRAVCGACFRTVRYHLGTIIFAAAIIALVQFARAVVTYMEKTMGAKKGKEPNRIQKVLLRVVNCLLWCLECCLDKINGNALIWVAIYGDAFCPAVCGSFKLIWENLVRVAAISFFSAMVTMLGKVLIPLLTMAVCGAALLYAEPFKSELSSPMLPLVVVFIIAFGVAQMFLTVYDTAIDTIFLCFLLDEKHNKADGQMLADPDLRAIVQKYEVESKQLADQKQRRTKDQAYQDDSEKEAVVV